ncbi:MAG: M15 family metallopeptidase [Labilithrix sp.]|nr:M15 family metallopeptidase [Labilithrix sp.]
MGPRRVALALVLSAACAADGEATSDHHEHAGDPIGTTSAALSDADPVSAAVAESCTTSVVKGLSTQLVDEIQCMRPGTFASIEGASGFTLGSAVFPWLQAPARDALLAAQRERGVTMTINSALRTLPQQYLLYRWYRSGRCGISLAASPGKSNHESALAVDIEDNAAWREAMRAHDLVWLGASDPVHFDYEGEGQVDIAGLSVLAFQRLWNRNHPEDRIAEDSTYGTATEERLAKAPVGGFTKGAECASPTPDESAPPGSGGGRGGPLGASGERRDGEGQGGCAIGVARGTSRGAAWSAIAFVGLAALGRRRVATSRKRAPAQRTGASTCVSARLPAPPA